MADDRDFPYEWCNPAEKTDLSQNIGKHCRLNKAALDFSKDCYIVNKKTHIPILKSKRIGKITGITKGGRYYVLWEGNLHSKLERPTFLNIQIERCENISQQGEQC